MLTLCGDATPRAAERGPSATLCGPPYRETLRPPWDAMPGRYATPYGMPACTATLATEGSGQALPWLSGFRPEVSWQSVEARAAKRQLRSDTSGNSRCPA